MSGALSPWLLLLAGFLAGWIVEWLLDLFFFRPREATDLRRHVACLQADRLQQEAELQQARATVANLQAELAEARRAAAHPSVASSSVSTEATPEGPAGSPPEVDTPAAELEQVARYVEAEAPEAEPAPEPAAGVVETVETKE